jgi:hypothetical protein
LRPWAPAERYISIKLHPLDAIRVLVELMCGANSESVRLNAAEAILSRGWGRPVQAFQVDGNFANRKPNELSNAELAAFEKRLANAEPQQGITDPNSGTGAMNG